MSATMAPPMPPISYSRREAAKRLGIGLNLLDNMIKAGSLAVVRLGRRVLVPALAVEQLLTRPLQNPKVPTDAHRG